MPILHLCATALSIENTVSCLFCFDFDVHMYAHVYVICASACAFGGMQACVSKQRPGEDGRCLPPLLSTLAFETEPCTEPELPVWVRLCEL